MPKTCLAAKCSNNAASHGYCWNHQYLRKDEKYTKDQKKKADNRQEQRQKAINKSKQSEIRHDSRVVESGVKKQVRVNKIASVSKKQKKNLQENYNPLRDAFIEAHAEDGCQIKSRVCTGRCECVQTGI